MPQLGETVIEGTITKWLKKEGDTIERDEPLFEISTDKVDTEVPSPLAGTLVEIKVQEGETVQVGTELALIDEGGGGNGQAAPLRAEPQAETAQAEPEPAAEEPKEAEQPAQGVPGEPADSAEPGDGQGRAAAPAPPVPQGDGHAGAAGGPMRQGTPSQQTQVLERGAGAGLISPVVRRLAEEHQIDLSQIQGTGTGGRVTRRDVMAFVEGGERQPQPQPQPVPQPEPEPQPV